MSDHNQCPACGSPLPPGEDMSGLPAVGDDEAWFVIGVDHEPNCEWVLTRGNQRDLPADIAD